jgi:hypothetical protein
VGMRSDNFKQTLDQILINLEDRDVEDDMEDDKRKIFSILNYFSCKKDCQNIRQ